MVEKIRQGDIPGVQLRCRQRLPVAASEVWQWLTRGERLALWLGERAAPDPEQPATIVVESTDERGDLWRERLAPVAAESPDLWVVDLQRLEAGWPAPTRLIFELTSDSEGTELSVLQTGFAHLPLSDCLTIWETYRRRWRAALTRLADIVAAPSDP